MKNPIRIRIAFAGGVALLALALTACSGEKSATDGAGAQSGTAQQGATANPSSGPWGGEKIGNWEEMAEAERRFAKCMRDHGVPVQDPGPDGDFEVNIPDGIPGGEESWKACKPLYDAIPSKRLSPEQVEKMRRYARCMRDNGIDYFIDPPADGDQANWNLDSVRLKQDPKREGAQEKCKSIWTQRASQ